MAETHQQSVGTDVETPPERPQPRLVMDTIAEALRLMGDAEQASRRGDECAANFQATVNRMHRRLLRSICELSEEEADRVEPVFTELETRLIRLSGVPKDVYFARA